MNKLTLLISTALLLTSSAASAEYNVWTYSHSINKGLSDPLPIENRDETLGAFTSAQAASELAGARSTGGFASADMRTGQLKAFAHAAGDHQSSTTVHASIYDNLVFKIHGGATKAAVLFDFSVHTTGSALGHSGWGLSSFINFGGAVLGMSQADSGINLVGEPNLYGSGFNSHSWVKVGDTFHGTALYELTAPTTHRWLYATLSGSIASFEPGAAAMFDARNTSSLRMTLPSNVTFSSSSQAFLSDVGAVPEPGTWAMMLLGFGFIGGTIRSAKRRQTVTVSYG